MSQLCEWCAKVTKNQCSECGYLAVCGKQCLKRLWPEHAMICKKLRVLLKKNEKQENKLLFTCKGEDLVIDESDERVKRDLFLRLPYAQRKHVVEYLDVHTFCRVDLVMKGNIYAHVAWQNAIKGTYSKAFSGWRHYGNTDSTFGGLIWAMNRRIVLKAPTIEAIYDYRGDALRDAPCQQFFWLCEQQDKVYHQLAEYLVQCDFFPNINATPSNRYSPLFTAAEMERIDVVVACIKAGAIVDQKMQNGFTSLYFCCQSDKRESIRALLNAGADPNLACCDGESPLLIACQMGNAEVVRILVQNGADVNLTKGSDPRLAPSALHLACTMGKNIEVLRTLLQHGASVDGPNMHLNESKRMETPFVATVYYFNHPLRRHILRELARCGANVNYVNEAKNLCLPGTRMHRSVDPVIHPYINATYHAVVLRDHELLKILMEVGADIDGFIKGKYEYAPPSSGLPNRALSMVLSIRRAELNDE